MDSDTSTRARIEEHWKASEVGDGDAEHAIYADGEPTYSVSIMEFTDGLVAHETQYFADPFPAPAPRAALAESIPAGER